MDRSSRCRPNSGTEAIRPLLALAAGALVLLPPLAAARLATLARPGGVAARPVPLDPGDPQRRRVGALRFLGGWHLSSDDKRFGGLSSLAVEGPGRLVAFTDAGMIVRLAMRGGRVSAAIGPQPGDPAAKRSRDAESLAYDPAGGRFWAGYEYRNAIVRIAPGLRRIEAAARPSAMAGWPDNGGAEAMTRLPDGRFLVIAETGGVAKGGRQALLFSGDPADPRTGAPIRFAYRPPDRFSPSDAAALPDGRVLVLNRRLALPFAFPAVISLIDPRGARPGTVMAGREVARIEPPLTVDNMEGMAVERTTDGLVLWLVSDDNFLTIQRTLLLRFALDPPNA